MKKILVLDDSPFMLKVISDMLKRLNYDVTAVDDGNVACQKVESTRYDMIITDMNMPSMDGLEFVRQVKSYPNCKFVPIVMLSSEKNEVNVARAKQLGVSTFLGKPLKESQLKSILQITLNKRRAPRIQVKLEVYYGENEILTECNASYTCNVSAGGLFLETKKPLTPGERLKLKISLPKENPPVFCQGRVAWVNSPLSPIDPALPTGMGIEFLDIEEELQLQTFLQSGDWKR